MGITSTHVEKTDNTIFTRLQVRDHLHSRGENFPFLMPICIDSGSPPLTWRKLSQHIDTADAIGITSTHVEKTLKDMQVVPKSRDHLHSRGENLEKLVKVSEDKGSPPLTWRKLGDDKGNITDYGITSTHVEKTYFNLSHQPLQQDHLHSRGEN